MYTTTKHLLLLLLSSFPLVAQVTLLQKSSNKKNNDPIDATYHLYVHTLHGTVRLKWTRRRRRPIRLWCVCVCVADVLHACYISPPVCWREGRGEGRSEQAHTHQRLLNEQQQQGKKKKKKKKRSSSRLAKFVSRVPPSLLTFRSLVIYRSLFNLFSSIEP